MHRHIALFDLDGVVFDTEPQYTIFWGSQFKKYYPQEPGLEHKVKGMTLVQIYDMYFNDQPQMQADITRELNDFEVNMNYEYVAGFEQFITKLRSIGVKTAVVTSSNREKMENVYAKHPEFKTYFDEVLTSEDFAKSKPDPDCYLKAAQKFGANVDECVGFEDSFNGLKSLQGANMTIVGLATTNSAETIAEYAHKVIDNYVGVNPSDLFFE